MLSAKLKRLWNIIRLVFEVVFVSGIRFIVQDMLESQTDGS
jgi:hypothetical protein